MAGASAITGCLRQRRPRGRHGAGGRPERRLWRGDRQCAVAEDARRAGRRAIPSSSRAAALPTRTSSCRRSRVAPVEPLAPVFLRFPLTKKGAVRGANALMATEIRVPTLGESISEATVGKWFKQRGDAVKADEPLVELETEKVTLEVNAPAAGVLAEIVAETGATVAIGALLGSLTARRGAAKPRRPRRRRGAARPRRSADRPRRPRCRRRPRPPRSPPRTASIVAASPAAASAARC